MAAEAQRTVLVVEDEELLRELTCGEIAELGFVVVAAASVAAAKEVLHRQSVDIVVTDLKMPGEDGLDLLRWLAASSPQRPPAIVVSGLTDRATKQQALGLGAIAVLAKPHAEEELREALALAVQRGAEQLKL